MSRSNRSSGSSSPVKKYLSFSGGTGLISYYDKEKEEKVELEEVSLILLDDLASVGGFNESESSGYSSNLLSPYDTGKKAFTVKSKVNGQYQTVEEGIWKEIKGSSNISGAKYARNLFALADVGDGLELVRLEVTGSGLSPWLSFVEDNGTSVYDSVVTVTKGQLYTRKAGKNTVFTDEQLAALDAKIAKNPRTQRPVLFYESSFDFGEKLSKEQEGAADEADAKLQEYLGGTDPEAASPDASHPAPSVVEVGVM